MPAPTTDLPIRFDNVGLDIGATAILEPLSFTLDGGGPTVLLGPNGAGKSTILRLAMSLATPTHGRLTWAGRDAAQAERRAIVFQRPVMLRRSVAANLAFYLDRARPPAAARSARMAELLQQVGLADCARRPARQLSGGEQQRLALARALARDPEILFLDEPTASLDPAAAKSVEAILRDIAASGIKIVMATHDLGLARRLADDILFIARGRLVESAPARQFFEAPATGQGAQFLRGDLVL